MLDPKNNRSGNPMNAPYLRSGIFLAPFHATADNPTLSMERDIELLQHLDRLNYHEAWIGEHHSGGVEIIAAPEMFIAAAAERTKHIRLGTGVSSLPYHNPFMLASRIVQLDHMTRGRAMFGVGPGALVYDAYKIGIPASEQRRMMNEALDVIIDLFNGKTVTKKTDWFNLVDAKLQLSPYTKPMIEMAVAASRSPVGALAASRHGLGMLAIGTATPASIERHAGNWTLYETEARKNGYVPDRSKWRVATLMHIAETREQAKKNVQFGLKAFCDYFREIATFPIVPADVVDDCEWLIETGNACIGTPDDAIAYIEKLLQGSGGFGVIMELAHNWADWDPTKRHYELMARYVHAHFQKSVAPRVEAYTHAAAHFKDFTQEAAAAVNSEIEKQAARQAKTGT
jgi:limonene 1,2-monooxygenase